MRRALVILFALLVLAPGAALAAAPRASLPDIEDEVMCVTCRVPLELAESPQADRERAFIRGLIARGETKAQIKDALVAQYGEAVLADPPKDGFSLAVWLVPVLVVLAALAGIAFALPRWRRARAVAAATEDGAEDEPPALDPEAAARLERELARYD